ncbi:CBS domain-containing protein CBSX1, chloroplastic [Sesamum angolense]|uniref:CBS domain-containing protein CBSX1, chloroplastic n=1 Tax=Sesamum angolense TaxID=2727404 RepID=A0AAE1X4L8_9LAMI|nr:CBS domain-containing protein CBSX1, chloroplastic [Sesamum angolense]
MDSVLFADFHAVFPRSGLISTGNGSSLPCIFTYYGRFPCLKPAVSCSASSGQRRRRRFSEFRRLDAAPFAAAGTTNSVPPREGIYTVGDFMTTKEHLHVVKPTTTVDEALETLVEKRITGFPVVDDDWKLVGVVSDYDLLALDSISGGGQEQETSIFPVVDSSWKTFNEIQKLLSKTNGRLLLKTKYRRLPVVDGEGKLLLLASLGGRYFQLGRVKVPFKQSMYGGKFSDVNCIGENCKLCHQLQEGSAVTIDLLAFLEMHLPFWGDGFRGMGCPYIVCYLHDILSFILQRGKFLFRPDLAEENQSHTM